MPSRISTHNQPSGRSQCAPTRLKTTTNRKPALKTKELKTPKVERCRYGLNYKGLRPSFCSQDSPTLKGRGRGKAKQTTAKHQAIDGKKYRRQTKQPRLRCEAVVLALTW